jgi:hypothetical protein
MRIIVPYRERYVILRTKRSQVVVLKRPNIISLWLCVCVSHPYKKKVQHPFLYPCWILSAIVPVLRPHPTPPL